MPEQWTLVPAQASPAEAPSGGGLFGSVWFLVAVFAIFYFLLIRPQSKARKEHTEMLSTLKKGDDVVTEGGILGVIREVRDGHVVLEVGERSTLRVKTESISGKQAPAKEDT